MERPARSERYVELIRLFGKLGSIGFGGPAVHMAMMEQEVVVRRNWMSRQHFLDLVGATNLIPGPNSTEMAIHIGYHRAGLPGLAIAGLSFIVPATLLTSVLAWLYAAYGTTPQAGPLLAGIQPAVLALMLGASWRLGRKAVKNLDLFLLGAVVVLACLAGVNEVVALFGGGIAGTLWLGRHPGVRSGHSGPAFALPFSTSRVSASAGSLAVMGILPQVSLLKLFAVFLKAGAVLYGSGYVLFAFLEGDLVERYGWLTNQQLLDAIAIGQFTPGPLLSTSTFIGFQVLGVPGAVVATLGIFLPSFLFVALLNPMVPKLRKNKWTAAFLDAVNVSAVGLMLAVILKLAATALVGGPAWSIALVAALAYFRWPQMNPAWLVLGGAACGYGFSLL